MVKTTEPNATTAVEPYLSIIIPTYNPAEFLPVLFDSIMTNKCLDEIEIILSDDKSTKGFHHILLKYPKLHFEVIENPVHAGFPRDGRQHGSEQAKGKWITFMDQDDHWHDGALDKIIEFIKTTGAHNMVESPFTEESVETGQVRIQAANKGWTHGKFYEMDFWRKYDIHYDKVQYCEDVDLSNRIDCVLSANRLKRFDYPEPLYVWRRRGDSLADEDYFRNSIPDHIRGTLGVLVDYVEQSKNDEELYKDFNVKFLSTFLHFFFYFQTSLLCTRKQMLMNAISIIQPIFTKYKTVTGMDNEDILRLFFNELINVYQQTRTEDFAQIPFIEQTTIIDWIHNYFD